MTAATLSEHEAIPAAYPATPSGLTGPAASADPAVIWARIEAWTAWRWSARAVTWIAEGPGEWRPRLHPFTIATVEIWDGDAWLTSEPGRTPLGGYELGFASYRFTGTAGASDAPPAAVQEAWRRLASYSEKRGDRAPGSSVTSFTLGDLSERVERSPDWLARALINSGAADLLRPYRSAP